MVKYVARTVKEIDALYHARVKDFRNTTFGGRKTQERPPPRASMNGQRMFGVDFSGSQFGAVMFRYCDLSNCQFKKAYLRWADFNHAILRDIDFSQADLRDSDLADTDLSGCDLSGCDLRKTDIWGSSLVRTNLTETRLEGAFISGGMLIDMDLTPICNAVDEVNLGTSYVDWMTVVRSVKNENLQKVLVKLGMPDVLADYSIEWAQSAATDVFRLFRSTFLIYGQPDQPFAEKLERLLRRNNIRTFFFPKHAVPGRRLHTEIRENINSHDRAVLICSHGSLDRDGVIVEIEEVLAGEYRGGGESYLIPIALDDYIYTWKPRRRALGDTIRDRVIGDFSGADKNDAILDAALPKLLRALRLPDRTTP